MSDWKSFYKKCEFIEPFHRCAWGFINDIVPQSSMIVPDSGAGFLGTMKDHVLTWYLVILEKEKVDSYFQTELRNTDFESMITSLLMVNLAELKKASLSKDTLLKRLTIIEERLVLMNSAATILRILDYAILPHLNKIARAVKQEDGVSLLAYPIKEIFSMREEKDILLASSKFPNLSADEKDDVIENLWIAHGYNSMGIYKEKVRTKEYYLQQMSDTKNPLDDLRNLEQTRNSMLASREAVMGQLSDDEKVYADFGSLLSYLKDEFKFNWDRALVYTQSFFDELSHELVIDKELLLDLRMRDIRDFIQKGTPLPNVSNRIAHNISIGMHNRYDFFEKDEADEFSTLFLKVEKEKDEFKGRITSRGEATGRAIIVHGSEDFHKVDKGDIIIVGNTTPDYVPILKKVSAIVAEEGGITAHVSIISREMKIPAVVGVRNATVLIKDGDLVEVDANKGTLRKL